MCELIIMDKKTGEITHHYIGRFNACMSKLYAIADEKRMIVRQRKHDEGTRFECYMGKPFEDAIVAKIYDTDIRILD